MRLLYVAFIVSTVALLWAAYAIARSVSRHKREAQGSALSLRGPSQDRDPESGP